MLKGPTFLIILAILFLQRQNLTAAQTCDEGNWFQGYTSDASIQYEVFDIAVKNSDTRFTIGGRTTEAKRYNSAMESDNGAIIFVYDSIDARTETLVWSAVISQWNGMMITSVLAIKFEMHNYEPYK